MPKFVAFLRAVNVGKRKYPMAELREALAAAGFTEVETHIQTGNVLLRTTMRSPAKVVEALEEAMREDRGFEVPVVLLTPAELAQVAADAETVRAEQEEPKWRQYVEPARSRATTRTRVALIEDDGIPGAGARRAPARRAPDATTGPTARRSSRARPWGGHLGVATNRNLTVIRNLLGEVEPMTASSSGGATPSSTRSTRARGPTPTATAWATCPASPPGSRTWPTSAWTPSGSRRSTPRRSTTPATTWPTTATSTRASGRWPTPTR